MNKSRAKFFLFSSILLLFLASGSARLSCLRNNFSSTTPVAFKDSSASVSIVAVGDIMCHTGQFTKARGANGSYDFSESFSLVRPIIRKADLRFCNLETVLAGNSSVYSGYPCFNSPDEFLDGIKYAGFDFIFTSNNHCYDRGEKGVLRTLSLLKARGLNSAGTNKSGREQDSSRIVVINGIKIAIISFTYGINSASVPSEKSFLINIISKAGLKSAISHAREQKPDILLLYLHFGQEYKTVPNRYQEDCIRFAEEAGVDIIIGGHPHVLQPVRYFKTNGSRLDTGFVAYSLGNFLSNQGGKEKETGAILSFKVIKNLRTGQMRIEGPGFIPTRVLKGEGRSFLIAPAEYGLIERPILKLSRLEKQSLKESYYYASSILGKFDPRVRPLSGI